ncbi:polyprenyl synthetase domain-containing protein [Hirsutella rhossiliensis]|uniref:Polyprenyl synthetase domain-containing protein n=1 Tax=Hirsutella rhossiliensis TaxID=111463 RepID=A0A9P8SEW7_9HYPO|nr:polyprenyl synthetase domain-containing protein [Hirsutella rhossiliensis]KAH0959464.1 polyprenyl synthetase domain-containing protein [Hirsutella rhossiliensis]
MCNQSPSSASPRHAAEAEATPVAPNYNLGNPLASPNAIPPRTSSSGLHARAAHQSSVISHQSTSPPSVLRPVSEGDWLSQKKKQTSSWLSPALDSPAMAVAQQQEASRPDAPQAAPDVDKYAHEDLHFAPERSWTEGKEKVVRAPFDYAISHPGKDFRSQVIAAFDAWLQVPPSSLQVITKVIAILHESSLLLDDVQDSSELRRGFPVAHNIFGIPQTINSANYMSFVALRELQELNSPRAISVFAEELVNLYRGQGMDLFWRDTLTCPTEDDYLEMVSNKTGGMFRLGIKLMQAESAANIDCVPLVNLVGLIFQIRDDYMNLSSTEYTENKGMCEDLTEGKFSFPIIHSIRSDSSNLRLVNILKQKTTDVQVKRYAVSYMESTGSFAYTRSVLTTLIERARKMALELDAGQNRAQGVLKILEKMVVE